MLSRTIHTGLFGSILALICGGAKPATQPATITPGAVWPDNNGNHIQAHGGGVIQLGDTFYWFGEQRARGLDRSKKYVSCYSSKDLANWTFRDNVLQQSDPEDFGPNWILERPKVYYNQKTKTYVMYMHIDGPKDKVGTGYNLARVGVATCDTVDGNYKYLRSFRPLGHESRDIGQFIDDDGIAYLIFEDRPTGGFHIAKLSDDYLTVEKETAFIHAPLEGGSMVHYNGLYYVVASHMTGWAANPDVYATAEHIEGPWTEFKDIAPPQTNTYGSQSSMLLKVTGSKTTSVIFIGDIWQPAAQWDSRYIWMPLEIGDGKVHLPQPRAWSIDVATGEATIDLNAPAMTPLRILPRRRRSTSGPASGPTTTP
jgi:hypothetical protein